MKALLLSVVSAVLVLSSCAARETPNSSGSKSNAIVESGTVRQVGQFQRTIRSKYQAVGLKDYVVITDNLERDRDTAEAVIHAKIELPHAMQTKARENFEAVLGRNFTFRANEEFFDREGYINNRVGDLSRVKQADYRNVVVQFITPDRALVTYSNIVEDQPGGPGAWKADMTWADILVKEDGKWKYEMIHLIEFKDLTTPKRL